jgi:hypothetical protein
MSISDNVVTFIKVLAILMFLHGVFTLLTGWSMAGIWSAPKEPITGLYSIAGALFLAGLLAIMKLARR